MPERFIPLMRLIRRTRIPWPPLTAASVISLADASLGLWIPLLVRDLVASAGDGAISSALVFTLAGVLLLEATLSGVSLYLLAAAGEHLTASLRTDLVGRLIRLPMTFHDDQQSGELVSRTMSDTKSIESLVTEQSIAFLTGLLTMLGALVILFLLDWQLMIVLLGCALGSLLLVLPVAARLQGIGRELQDQQASFSGRLAAVLSEVRLLKASCAEREEEERAGEAIGGLRRLGLREARILAVLGPATTLGVSGALVAILGFGGARVASGALEVGTLVAFMLYLFQVVLPMVQFSSFAAALNKAAGAAEHLGGLLELEEEERNEGGRLAPAGSGLELLGVSHAYGEGEAVLRDLHLEIPAGQVTALVGPSGGGKTTVLSLVERFYAPRAGEIRVGGVPLDELRLESWRRRIGYVTQEAPLLAGTVRENLLYGLPGSPDDEKIRQALRAARAETFVDELPAGLDTDIGERGVKLSGGQRQRLALGRAFLTDPEILVLDEATANLDAESESAVREAMGVLMKGRTTVVVAHRLSTVVHADQIAVLEAGRITGCGRHDDLMRSHDVYRDLVERQRLGEAAAA